MARFATADEADVYHRLHSVIAANNRRNALRSQFAEAEALMQGLDYHLPSGRTVEQTPLHWPQKAIEVFSSRAKPRFYSMEGGEDVLNELRDAWEDSTVEFAEQLAIESALRHGPSFVFTSAGDVEAGEPEVIVAQRSALSATAEINPRTRRVTAALELLDQRRANLYLPDRVLEIERRVGRLIVHEEVETFGVPCAPYIHGATTSRPYGSSRISRPVMAFTLAAMRTFQRQEVSADWYSHPRERLLGVGKDVFEGDGASWTQSPGDIQVMPDVHPDDDPTIPDNLRRAQWHVTPQMSMQPFSDQFRLIASQFSGASSIPLQYLGITQDSNPTSAQAIEAQDIDLVRAVKDQYPSFNLGRRMLAINILSVLRGEAVDPREVAKLRPRWDDPRVRSVQEQSQFVATQVGAGNFQAGTEATLSLLPMPVEDVQTHALENRRAAGSSLLDRLTNRSEPTGPAVQDVPATDSAEELKAKFDALGIAIRAGVDADEAATRVGLPGLKFIPGARPVTIRVGEEA